MRIPLFRKAYCHFQQPQGGIPFSTPCSKSCCGCFDRPARHCNVSPSSPSRNFVEESPRLTHHTPRRQNKHRARLAIIQHGVKTNILYGGSPINIVRIMRYEPNDTITPARLESKSVILVGPSNVIRFTNGRPCK